MNRKRDLANIGLIYEGYAGIDPENIGVSTSTGAQKKAIKGLLRRGYEIHDEYTKKAGGEEIVLVRGENLIKNLNDSEEVVGVDIQGKINGQPYQSFLAGIEEDEQSSAFGQELADEREDKDPVLNLKDNFNYEDEEIETEFQQELDNDENEESMEGKIVSFTTKPSLDQIRAGVGIETFKGKVVQDLGDSVLMDVGVGLAEIPKDELNLGEEDAEDLGPNQQPESWGDEAMGSEKPGQTSQRFAQDTINNPDDDPAYGPHDPDEQEEDDMDLEKAIKVINKHLKARVHGDESHASKEVRDAKKAYIKDFVKKRKKEETGRIPIGIDSFKIKKESFNSHGDRDMSLLAENYLNIKHHE